MTALLWLALALAPPPAAPPRATLYVFFATWCHSCRAELPAAAELHRRHAAEGLRVVLVSVDGPSSAGAVPPLLAEVAPGVPWLHDAESALLERYHPAGSVPFSVLLGGDGRVRYAHAGYEPGDERAIETAALDLLAPAPAPTPEAASASAPADVQAALQLFGARRTTTFATGGSTAVSAGAGRLELTAETALGSSVVSGRPAPVVVHARVDGSTVDGAGQDGESRELERAYLDLRLERVHLRGGDGYVRLGHGVSLSLRKLDALGLDTALRGGRGDVQAGPVRLTAFGGFSNPQNLDPVELKVMPDPWDRMAGGQATIALGPATLAPYALWVQAPHAAADGRDVVWTLGGAAAALELPGWRVEADGATGERTGRRAEPEVPWALHGRVTRELGPVTLLLEGKGYRHWQIGRPERRLLYHEPPTLERADQPAPGNEDSAGGRVRLEARVADGVAVHGSVMGYGYATDGGDPLGSNRAWHGYGGLTASGEGGRALDLGGGQRLEQRPDGKALHKLWHVEGGGSIAATTRLGLSGRFQHYEEGKASLDGGRDFQRGSVSGSATYRQRVTASVLYGYTTELPARPTHYPAAEVRVVLGLGGEVRLFAGRVPGGLQCVSGTCRELPPFEGVRADLVLRM